MADLQPIDMYHLLASLVIPRPIAWVSTASTDGNLNLAPHSFFNIVSADPPIVHFTQTRRKDTLRNCLERPEFVVNIVSRELLEQANLTAADFPPDEDEFAHADLRAAPSKVVGVPRVARAKAALECRVREVKTIGDAHMVFGDVVHVFVDKSVWIDDRIDPTLLAPVGRLGGRLYATVETVEYLARPCWDMTSGTVKYPPAQRPSTDSSS